MRRHSRCRASEAGTGVPKQRGDTMPVTVTEYYNDGFYTIVYGVENLVWYDADSQAEVFLILAGIAEDGYICSLEWERKA